MERIVGEYLLGLQFGDMQVHKNLAVIPLFSAANGGPHYLTLKHAIDGHVLTISEVSEGGSVPELKVKNAGDAAVLLLDGEELSGAKQNRVLNTTILIDGHTEMTIPVSCTEQGRWSYTQRQFGDSDVVMASRIRSQKVRSVSRNLEQGATYRSDQGDVWDRIHKMAADAKVHSETSAMKDVYAAREEELDDYLKTIVCQPDQRGMIVLINGIAVGLDCLSLDSAWSVLHSKLVKSYAMEAVLDQKEKGKDASVDVAKSFVAAAAGCSERKYKSVGLGWDYRFEAERLVGSALEHEAHVIHTAFFPMESSEKIGNMAGYRRRRAYRI